MRSGKLAMFSPVSLPSREAWFDASSVGGADNDTIQTWTDRFNGRDATQGTAANRATLKLGVQAGRNVLRFDGTTDMYAATGQSVNLKPFSFACAVKPDAANVLSTVIGPTVNDGIDIRVNTSSRWELLQAGVASIGSSSVNITAAWQVLVVTYDSSGNYAFYRNGTAEGSGLNNQTFSASTLRIGHGNDANPERWDGDMGELILCSVLWTAQERGAVTRYLGSKWGITVA